MTELQSYHLFVTGINIFLTLFGAFILIHILEEEV